MEIVGGGDVLASKCVHWVLGTAPRVSLNRQRPGSKYEGSLHERRYYIDI